jgi:hypothetical protein
MGGKSYCAEQCKDVSQADGAEEVLPGGTRGCCEEEETGEGEDNADSTGPAGRWCSRGTNGREDSQQRDEDDYEASDEGGFRCGCAGEACGLELISGGEEDANHDTGEEALTFDGAELSAVYDCQRKEGQSHSDQIEEERRGVLKSVFDQDKGCSPDDDDRQEQ